ncbi:MAG: hypothetical protein P4N60_20225 [Verrucomicrobiae bacterium]|nr:hypothetical protein [Verrucomicrobiae bacterium]
MNIVEFKTGTKKPARGDGESSVEDLDCGLLTNEASVFRTPRRHWLPIRRLKAMFRRDAELRFVIRVAQLACRRRGLAAGDTGERVQSVHNDRGGRRYREPGNRHYKWTA